MVIVFGDNTVLNVDKVISLLIKYTPDKEKILRTKGFLGLFPEYETTNVDKWTLEFQYTNGGRSTQDTFTCVSTHYPTLVEQAKQIIVQLRKYDNTIIDQAFEDAFLKDK